jgi:hypothetical protein
MDVLKIASNKMVNIQNLHHGVKTKGDKEIELILK